VTAGTPDQKGRAKVDTYKRRLAMLVYVLERGFAEVSDLASKFGCHVNSVRADVKGLEGRGSLIRLLSPDLVVSLAPVFSNEALSRRLTTALEEKWTVARRALELLGDTDSVFLSGGATTFLLALEIARSDKKSIRVVTSVLYTQQFLRAVDQVRILGGRAARHSGVIECAPGVSTLREHKVNKAFLGVDALSWDAGAFCVPSNGALQRSACFAASDTAVFLADHSEVGRALPEGQFVSFKELEKESRPYVVICDCAIKDSEEARRVDRELAKFPKGRLVRA